MKDILVASAAVGYEDNNSNNDDEDGYEGSDVSRRASCFQTFGQRPASPRSNRSTSQLSIPSHPNSLDSDDGEKLPSDMGKERLEEGNLYRLI